MRSIFLFVLTTFLFTPLYPSSLLALDMPVIDNYRSSESYCVAIRGNGELQPAHNGAMARLVETLGMPAAMSGGSSATITMFLIESIALNPIFKNLEQNSEEYRQTAALLIKSLTGYFDVLKNTDEVKAIQNLFMDEVLKSKIVELVQSYKNGALEHSSMDQETRNNYIQMISKHQEDFQAIIKGSILKNLINEEMLNYIRETNTLAEQLKTESPERAARIKKEIEFRYSELENAIKLFGAFNAQTDSNLFVRLGLVDFKKLARLFNRIANFYAGYGFDATDTQNFQNFVKTCQSSSANKRWEEFANSQPTESNESNESDNAFGNCHQKFNKAVTLYRNKMLAQEGLNPEGSEQFPMRMNDILGRKILAIPSTSILQGKTGLKNYRDFVTAYEAVDFEGEFDNDSGVYKHQYGERFVPDFNQIKFGYIGTKGLLDPLILLRANMDKRKEEKGLDAKSQKFWHLDKEYSWFDALRTSPAEPGLSRPVPFEQNGAVKNISFGGWSDLHPTLVLRDLGCANIVYVTRRDGESLFGTGVLKRLLPDQFTMLPWEKMNQVNNNNGYLDVGVNRFNNSVGGELISIGNPESSISLSIAEADAVVCTDWNRHDIKNGVLPLVKDGHEAKVYFKDTPDGKDSAFKSRWITNGFPQNYVIAKDEYTDRTEVKEESYPKWAGCIPL